MASPYEFSPWIWNSKELAAVNLADHYCNNFEAFCHYGLPILGWMAYEGLYQWRNKDNAVSPGNRITIQPAPNRQGLLPWLFNKFIEKPAIGAVNFVTSLYKGKGLHKAVGRFTFAESASEFMHDAYLAKNFWAYNRPIFHAIARPIAEKRVDSMFECFDKGDINFQGRDLVIGGEGAGGLGGWLTFVNKPFWHLRNAIGRFMGHTYAEQSAPWYYEKSKYLTDIVSDMLATCRDTIWAAGQVAKTLLSPRKTIQGIKAIWEYFAPSRQAVWEYSTPIRDAGHEWGEFVCEKLNDLTYGATGAMSDGLMWGCEKTSDLLERKTDIHIPPQYLYYGAVGLASAAGTVAAWLGAKAAYYRLQQWVHNVGPGVVVNNRMINLLFGPPAAVAAPAPVPGAPVPGAPIPGAPLVPPGGP